MSRATRRRRRPAAPEGVLRRHKTQDTRHKTQGLGLGSGVRGLVIIAILAAIPFFMGKYFEFNSFGPFDSGAYVYSAAHILDGAEIGVDEKPSAQLGTLLVNLLGVRLFGFEETGPKMIQGIMQAAALILMFIAMRKLYGTLPAAVGVIVASVYLSWACVGKTGNTKEQYMIACMVMGISCFVLYQLGGRWWLAFLAGAFVSWAPLFKQTGVSAIGAIGLFVVLQPLLRNRTPKQTVLDILLLLAGAAAAIAPLYVWIIAWDVQMSLPYSFLWETLAKFLPAGADSEPAKAASDYISGSRKLVPFSRQWPKVLHYYWLLIMPIVLATLAIVARFGRMLLLLKIANRKSQVANRYDRFVLLFATWWLLDMAFVWISPRSYVQYYLPLNASAAMLGGYLIAIYWDRAKSTVYKTKWLIAGTAGLLLMIVLSWHVFFDSGIRKYPSEYSYAQMLRHASLQSRGLAQSRGEAVGEYIRAHSKPTDKIYVWGWIPGIYVKAQRFSSASKAFSMPRPAPAVLAEIVATLLREFEKEMPKFIVDTRKRHIPVDRPPYELWPIVRYEGAKREAFLALDENAIAAYEKAWAEMLQRRFGDEEAERFRALAPFRKFVMKNYEIAETKQYGLTQDGRLLHRMFGEEVLFKLKDSTSEDPA